MVQKGYQLSLKNSENGFFIIFVYVNNINIIKTPKELPKAIACLKFEMKYLWRTKFCWGLQRCLKGSIYRERFISSSKIMMLGLYIEVLKMRRITQPEEGGHHPRWERGVMLRKGLPICPACPKNLLWKNRGVLVV